MINFVNLTVKEAEIILAGLMELPKRISDELHAKLHKSATEQYIQATKPQEDTNAPSN